MAGIVGVCSVKGLSQIENNWSLMLSTLKTETSLIVDQYYQPTNSFALVHLGVTNPEPQPIYNQARTKFIFMEGELYDYEKRKQELVRKGYSFVHNNDPEFALHLYEEVGDRFVSELNGIFALCIFDIVQKRLLLANDRYGYCQLYYWQGEKSLIFSSRIDTILASGMFKPTLSVQAFASFFNSGQMIDDETWVSQIKVFPPGSVLNWQDGKSSINQYWDFHYQEEELGSEEDIAQNLAFLFEQGLKRQVAKGGGKLGVCLSGGFDSRLLTALAVRESSGLDTVTFGITDSRDVVYAKMVAELLGTEHHCYQIEPHHHLLPAAKALQAGEGMLLPHHLHVQHLLPLIRQETGIRIFFSGFAGDLLLGGSYFFPDVLEADKAGEVFECVLTRNYKVIKPHMEAEFFTQRVLSQVAGRTRETVANVWKRSAGDNLVNRHEHFSLLTRVRRFTQLGLASVNSFFASRLPFYDNDFIDYLMRVPIRYRRDHRIYLKVMALINPEILEIPYSKTGQMPNGDNPSKDIIARYHLAGLRESFVDYTGWSRRNNQEYFRKSLFASSLLDLGIFNEKYLEQILKAHMDGYRNYINVLYAVINFDGVCQKYFPDGITLDS